MQAITNQYDFHCHSSYSDGELSPGTLLSRAQERGLRWLAITDHDTTAGVDYLLERKSKNQQSSELQPTIIPGVEISTATDFGEVHVVGLGVNTKNETLQDILNRHQNLRRERANLIDQQLKKIDIQGVLEKVESYGSVVITRTHFARALVDLGIAPDAKRAFKRFLGRSGKIKSSAQWTSLETVIAAIESAGGISVLAHPTRYPLTNRKLGLLVGDFALAGGRGLEMAYPGLSPNHLAWLEQLRETQNLLASSGSDFHFSNRPWCDLGRFYSIEKSRPHVASLLCK